HQLGLPSIAKEKGRGPLQTSALPLGYGAVRHKLAIYLDFLNPPREVLPTSLNLCRASGLQYRRVMNGRNRWSFQRTRRICPLAKSRCGDFVGNCRQANALRRLTSASPRPSYHVCSCAARPGAVAVYLDVTTIAWARSWAEVIGYGASEPPATMVNVRRR